MTALNEKKLGGTLKKQTLIYRKIGLVFLPGIA